jgi:hypothetical protein
VVSLIDKDDVNEADSIYSDIKKRDHLIRFHKALSSEKRIKVLLGMKQGKDRAEISRDRGSTTPLGAETAGLRRVDLLFKPYDEDRTYAITPLGTYATKDIQEPSKIVETYEILEEEQKEVERKLERETPLSEENSNWQDIVQRKKWHNEWDNIKSKLEIQENPYEPGSEYL